MGVVSVLKVWLAGAAAGDDMVLNEEMARAFLDTALVFAGAGLGALAGFDLQQRYRDKKREDRDRAGQSYSFKACGPGWCIEVSGEGKCQPPECGHGAAPDGGTPGPETDGTAQPDSPDGRQTEP